MPVDSVTFAPLQGGGHDWRPLIKITNMAEWHAVQE